MEDHELTELSNLLDRFISKSGSTYNKWKYVLECANSIWTLCKFNIDDRVQLTKAPDCNNGWRGAKHFLIIGAKGTVRNRQFYKGKFLIYVAFDNDSYIDIDGNIKLSSRKGLYSLNEDYLELSTENTKNIDMFDVFRLF